MLQKVKCGKSSCRCAGPGGQLHGPYWYFYYRKDGKNIGQIFGEEWARWMTTCYMLLFTEAPKIIGKI